jgi:hypothetical protein
VVGHGGSLAQIAGKRGHGLRQSLDSQALVELIGCCCCRSLSRLGELVDQIIVERQVAQPPLPLDT